MRLTTSYEDYVALKHGGKLFMLDKQARLEAPEDCTLQITDKFIILTSSSDKKYIYPKPNQFTVSFNEHNTYKKGELVGVIHHLSTPAYVLNSIEKLTRAQAARADKAFMKNRVIESDCYCIADGVIHYAINPATNLMSVSIGDQWYEYNPDAMYQFPEGASVKKYDRICSGVLDMNIMTQKVTDYEQLFYYYRNQFNELMSIAPELIEFAYSILVKSIRGNIVVRSVIQSIKNSKSLYTSTAFGYAGQLYKQVPVTGMQWFDDQMSRVLLPLISDEHFI